MKPAALQAEPDQPARIFAPASDEKSPRVSFARIAVILSFLAYVAAMGAAWWVVLQVVPAHVSFTVFGRTLDTESAHEHINNTALIFLLL
ncbi:MAG: hypothetical protein B7Y78_11320, partial [Caulobacter sp. 35-67-4]